MPAPNEPVCVHCGKEKCQHLSLIWCTATGHTTFTPAHPAPDFESANQATSDALASKADVIAERDRLRAELAAKDAEIQRLKTRVLATKWQEPGEQALILKGSREETRELMHQYWGGEDNAQLVAGREMHMTNAELETLPEWQS